MGPEGTSLAAGEELIGQGGCGSREASQEDPGVQSQGME